MADGKVLVIDAPANSPENVYVSDLSLNGKKVEVNYVTHSQLQAGGKLEFSMSPVPDRERGINPDSRPYSFSTRQK